MFPFTNRLNNRYFRRIEFLILMVFGLCSSSLHAQNFTSYFTGDTTDVVTNPTGGVCLMGGATEDDNAMRWFLERADGGDILVLRASGSNGYNAYFYSQLGVTVNSVESIVCNNPNASAEAYLHERIQKAEAIWFAGGDQWNYVSFWRNTAVDSLINQAISQRHIVIGGTSAGMAILGKYYFSALNGTVTSATAMGNPYAPAVAVDSMPFLKNRFLEDVITDTHYDYYDRRGRQVTFLARIRTDWGVAAKGIACDEYTAVCVDTNGLARVFGDYPASDDNAYFVQVNCEIPNNQPEVCLPNVPLQWDQNSHAIKTYVIKGTANGANTFDLTDWKTGSGGSWEAWSVYNNSLLASPTTEISCGPVAIAASGASTQFEIWPNPNDGKALFFQAASDEFSSMELINAFGQLLLERELRGNTSVHEISLPNLAAGIYWIKLQGANAVMTQKLIVK